jgi:hypothetical protein
VFEVSGVIEDLRVIGDGTHARVRIDLGQQSLSGVWFNFRQNNQAPMPVAVGDEVACAFMLKATDFGGVRKCEMQVVWLEKTDRHLQNAIA